jgi:kumamolisin
MIKFDKWINKYNSIPNIRVVRPDSFLKFKNNAIKNKSFGINRDVSKTYFNAAEIASIYKIPTPSSSKVVVGVISFGGGLYGNVDSNGFLTDGDVQQYWTSIGIPILNQPKVIIIPINGAKNLPDINDGGSTIENTLDVETIGGCCPSANLTIILYIGPNTFSEFTKIISYATKTIVINNVSYKPTILSISWGAPEIYYPKSILNNVNTLLKIATNSGINICTATGDNGSSDGLRGINADFPSSSPYVTAVGGTSLVCSNKIYDSKTQETAWSSCGGAISAYFVKPTYQNNKRAISAKYRSTPDIASNANPNTGISYLVKGNYYVYGGTSISAPTVAAFLAAGNITKFINPFLYRASSSCFHDITSGSNGAYKAKKFYDNCTGWGSINGSNLLKFLKLKPIKK